MLRRPPTETAICGRSESAPIGHRASEPKTDNDFYLGSCGNALWLDTDGTHPIEDKRLGSSGADHNNERQF